MTTPTQTVSLHRKLDAEIAEKVFGFPVHRCDLGRTTYTESYDDGTPMGGRRGCREYSTTWEGMGLLVEKMRELGYRMEIEIDPESVCCSVFEIDKENDNYIPLTGNCNDRDSAPHACAIAALKAVS